jgi:dynein intermediate chain
VSLGEYSYVPQFPELAVASYNKNLAAPNDPDGIVAVWNLHLLERPEFVFHSPVSDLPTSIQPMVPSRLVASDMIAPVRRPLRDVLPVPPDPDIRRVLFRPSPPLGHSLKTPLSAAGHTYPIYAMKMVGTQNANNLISTSTDGLVCSWLADMLSQPQVSREVIHGQLDLVPSWQWCGDAADPV